ncbi:hypothetical protein [Nocardia seriolae]|uniref:SprT-like domain-containing protein n=1 Tax=Nocardia seriolae TaxID=37332 RepID=A0ABC8ASG9_9NOCA|nr:hypothetical protein [Nocardia seriolae]APA97093.1 hypothetical protein NS506_03036 [Nocardia seriolae]OJF81845.1 hypothetical protein NS14008_25105 [Nocardia seriolae]PSK26590.1 hypothetical protein C6575_36500 [Nocardia seriolae]QOW34071.1 hypothetical protein IMZ23_02750 [Nocardia seriolae]QUN18424.1 hypothetical protein KEC46_02975 [Nocardia seriolae]
MTDSDTITGLLVTAVENTWAAIRSRHPDVPDVVLTVGAGSTGGSDLTLGHFAPNRWVRGEYELHELFVGGEGLQRGAVDVLGTLLHEAAHGIAEVREIKDTSRQGRWHNERYRELAEELGLIVAHHDKIGWSLTTVPDSTRDRYRDELDELAFALVAHRRREPERRGGRKSNNNGLSVECDCGRKIRVSQSVYDAGPIYCGLCDGCFSPADV